METTDLVKDFRNGNHLQLKKVNNSIWLGKYCDQIFPYCQSTFTDWTMKWKNFRFDDNNEFARIFCGIDC